MENVVLLEIIIGLILAQTLFLVVLIRAAISTLVEEIAQLDVSIAEALRSIVENVNLEGIEPPNTGQMLVMKIIEAIIANKPIDARVIPERGSTGRFKSEKPLSAD